MTNGSEFQRQLAERVRFYRELGIYDFYNRKNASNLVPSAVETQHAASLPCTSASPTQPDVSAESAEEMTAERALRIIREDLGDCTRCVLHKQGRKQIVFGVGNARADIMFVGEAPGADEDQQGEPFVGRAGQLLTQMIEGTAKKEGIPLQRDDVYICNVVKCRPPENRTPEADEMATCGEFLFRQLSAINPKAICALGSTAAKAQ